MPNWKTIRKGSELDLVVQIAQSFSGRWVKWHAAEQGPLSIQVAGSHVVEAVWARLPWLDHQFEAPD